jgi:glycosyltransferase involved in cell wall biosynthesis
MSKNSCVIYAPVDTLSGYGARSRDTVKSIIELKKDEWDIKVIPCPWGNTPTGFIRENSEWHFLSEYILPSPQLNAQPDIMIWITVPNEFQKVGKYNIGITAGLEINIVPADWVEGVNRMDLVLVSSEHSKKAFIESKFQRVNDKTKQVEGTVEVKVPIEVIFEGIDTNIYKHLDKPNVKVGNLDQIPEDFCYLFVGHWLQGDLGEDRKNVGLLIKAFLEVFKNKKNKPALILKTSLVGPSYMDRDEVLKRVNMIKRMASSLDVPNVYLLHGEFTDAEMNELYNHPKVKAMVSLTKGEGFGRPLLEFTQSKKPLLTTNFSGHLDFLKGEFTTLINGTLTNVHPSAANNMLIKEGQWFSPDHGQIGHYLKDMFENYKDYVDGGKRQGFYCKQNFSFEKMTEKMKEYLSRVPEFPKQIALKLPQLKKIELPKLTKI